MIKAKPSSALKTVIDTNKINLDTTEWVERARETANQGKGTGQGDGWDEKFQGDGSFFLRGSSVSTHQGTEVRCYTTCS
jgi:hypothetical protein